MSQDSYIICSGKTLNQGQDKDGKVYFSEKRELVELIRAQVGDYASRYRRDSKTKGLRSFTTMQTALNALAGYYSSYGVRPLPERLQKRLEIQFGRVEFSLYRGI